MEDGTLKELVYGNVTLVLGNVTINPTADTYVYSGNPDSNYGGQNNLRISKYEFYEIVYQDVTWLKFNLSSVPDGAVVDVATLELYCSWVSETYNIYAHYCSDNSWTELGLTYSNMPLWSPGSMDSTTVPTSSEWYSWNVLEAVQDSVDGIHGGPDIVTIVLRETTNRGTYAWVSFYSNDNSFNKSKLTVHWSGIIPEFPSFLILPLFMITTLLIVIVYRRKGHFIS